MLDVVCALYSNRMDRAAAKYKSRNIYKMVTTLLPYFWVIATTATRANTTHALYLTNAYYIFYISVSILNTKLSFNFTVTAMLTLTTLDIRNTCNIASYNTRLTYVIKYKCRQINIKNCFWKQGLNRGLLAWGVLHPRVCF